MAHFDEPQLAFTKVLSLCPPNKNESNHGKRENSNNGVKEVHSLHAEKVDSCKSIVVTPGRLLLKQNARRMPRLMERLESEPNNDDDSNYDCGQRNQKIHCCG
jgi:hypothetical protein